MALEQLVKQVHKRASKAILVKEQAREGALVALGVQGLSWQGQIRLRRFRREMEAELRRRGLHDRAEWLQRLTEAGNAKAMQIRAGFRLVAHQKGKRKLSARAELAQERLIAKADKVITKFVTDLADDAWRLYGTAPQQLAVDASPPIPAQSESTPASEANARPTPIQTPQKNLNSIPTLKAHQVSEPSHPNATLMSAAKGSLFEGLKRKRKAKPTPPNHDVQISTYVESAERSAVDANTTSSAFVPISSHVSTSGKPPNLAPTASPKVAQKKKKAKGKPPKVVEPAKIEPVEEKPSWMPPEPGGWFAEMCAHYGRLGYHPYPIGKNERGEFVFAKLPQTRPAPQTTESDFWPDGSKKCVKFV
jgi:hypothetical protein